MKKTTEDMKQADNRLEEDGVDETLDENGLRESEEPSISSKLNKLIKARGYTQAQFAEAAGVKLSSLRFMIKPDARLEHVRASSLIAVCSLLDIDPRELFDTPRGGDPDGISAMERVRLLTTFNQLNDETRDEILALMESLLKDPSRCRKLKAAENADADGNGQDADEE